MGKLQLPRDLKEFLRLLNSNSVEYLRGDLATADLEHLPHPR